MPKPLRSRVTLYHLVCAHQSADQQAALCVHGVRQGLNGERTALINQLRGLLSEFGVVLPKGRYPAAPPAIFKLYFCGIVLRSKTTKLRLNNCLTEAQRAGVMLERLVF